MNHRTQKSHTADSMFTFLLLLVFLLFSLLLISIGSAIYRKGAESLDENYTSRTAIGYVQEKVRQHDSESSIFLTSLEEIPALALRDAINGENYVTYIYYYDGALRELFTREDNTPLAAAGSNIVELSSFSVTELEGNLLLVEAAGESGEILSTVIHPDTGTDSGS